MTPSAAPIIEVKDLTKKYNSHVAVDHIDLVIPKGVCFGLLGPNGAGKTTTVEMMESILAPDSGTILYRGAPLDREFHEQIGIQFQHTELLAFLSVRETLKTFAAFYKKHITIDTIVKLCMLEQIEHQLNNKISGGQRQRLLLGLALLNDPALIFLDEPSTGLDPQARQHIWEIIENMKAKGKTIVLTTHYMEEAQSLCDEVAIMDKGVIIEQGRPADLIDKHCMDGTDSENLESVFLTLTGRHLRE